MWHICDLFKGRWAETPNQPSRRLRGFSIVGVIPGLGRPLVPCAAAGEIVAEAGAQPPREVKALSRDDVWIAVHIIDPDLPETVFDQQWAHWLECKCRFS